MFRQIISEISPNTPVLIAGPTASGKSALALDIAQTQGGVIINADASQIFDCWQIVTARPDAKDLACAPHALYGHVPYDVPYSAGHWAREVTPLLTNGPRPIIVGGTGLYFMSLIEGLNPIPPTPDAIRTQADTLPLKQLLNHLDTPTRARLDTKNRARVQRAYEVLHSTGKSLIEWQDAPTQPILALPQTHAFVFDAPKSWLTPRIEARFDQMMDQGAEDEVRNMLPHYDDTRPAFRAIGVPEITAYLRGEITRQEAKDKATIATRQYAKRQRTWFAKRCADWRWISAASG